MKEINYDQSNEIEKYRKSTESNVSKSKKKSRHKHQYEECLIQYKFKRDEDRIHLGLSSYCTICGKLGGQFDQDKSIVSDYIQVIYRNGFGKCYKVMPDEELYEKYRNKLPVFYIGILFDTKYVPLDKNDKSVGE